jgi:hypothetical protein
LGVIEMDVEKIYAWGYFGLLKRKKEPDITYKYWNRWYKKGDD